MLPLGHFFVYLHFQIKMKRGTFLVPVKREAGKVGKSVPQNLTKQSENIITSLQSKKKTKPKRSLVPCTGLVTPIPSPLSPTDLVSSFKDLVSLTTDLAPPNTNLAASTAHIVSPTPDKVSTTTDKVSPSKDKPSPITDLEKGGLRPPKKPESSFTMFVRQHRKTLSKQGLSLDEATEKAIKMWRITSPIVKNKYQNKYEKLKTKYEADLVKHNEKLKKGKDRAEKKEGE